MFLQESVNILFKKKNKIKIQEYKFDHSAQFILFISLKSVF